MKMAVCFHGCTMAQALMFPPVKIWHTTRRSTNQRLPRHSIFAMSWQALISLQEPIQARRKIWLGPSVTHWQPHRAGRKSAWLARRAALLSIRSPLFVCSLLLVCSLCCSATACGPPAITFSVQLTAWPVMLFSYIPPIFQLARHCLIYWFMTLDIYQFINSKLFENR